MIATAKKRKKLLSRNALIIILIVIASLFFIFALNFYRNSVRNFFYHISSPAQKILWSAGSEIHNFIISLASLRNYQEKIDNLTSENDKLLVRIAELKNVSKENDSLRKALDLGLNKEFKLDYAYIIGKSTAGDKIMIDRGSEDGIAENMAVMTEEKIAVGKISEVYKNFSKVSLISDKKSYFDAVIQDKDVSGMVKGEGNLKISFDLIPRDKELSRDDLAVTSSLGGIFPGGLLVGRVSNIKKNDVDPFQQVELTPFFDISKASSVFIIILK